MIKISLKALFSFGVLILVLTLAYVFTTLWPVTFFKVDPEKTPFIGDSQSNGYTMYNNLVTNSTGRFRTHKIILGVLAVCVLVGGFFQGMRSFLSREVVIPSVSKLARSNVFLCLVLF